MKETVFNLPLCDSARASCRFYGRCIMLNGLTFSGSTRRPANRFFPVVLLPGALPV